jgi:hypothetical protein
MAKIGRIYSRRAELLTFFFLLGSIVVGCKRETTVTVEDTATSPVAAESPNSGDANIGGVPLAVAELELDATAMQSMALSSDEATQGWVRLFDGHTLFGWEMVGTANWRVADQTLRVDQGEKSLLCTTLPWKDFEFRCEFRAGAQTNSGIFLRTPIAPEDPARDCYELNIAPPENPFPTGSLVARRKFEPADLGALAVDSWHAYRVRVAGDQVTIWLNDRELYSYTDPMPLTAGRIALQHNEGEVAFRNVLARPLGLQPLFPTERTPGAELTNWVQYPDMPGSIDWDSEGNLHVRGGKKQLESKGRFADFALVAQVKTNGPQQNSGIFFRCIPGEEMNGYECQINNDARDGNPLFPADCGTGGFFRRQDARLLMAKTDEWFTLLLITAGPKMAAYVNGIQVSDWQDTRPADPNPRRGSRLEAGSLMLQGHDQTTDVLFKSIEIVDL